MRYHLKLIDIDMKYFAVAASLQNFQQKTNSSYSITFDISEILLVHNCLII